MQASMRRLVGLGPRRLGARGVTHSAADTRLDNAVEEFARIKPRRLSVKELLDFASNPDRISLIEGARYLQKELPVRLAHRIQDMHKLPFIVGCNPHINQVYNLYLEAFHEFRSVPEIKSLEQQSQFVDVVAGMVKKHGGVISTLGQSVHEIQQYMPASDLKQFLDKMIRTRISRRVIVEQHISVYRSFSTHRPQPPGFLGIFDTACNPARLCTKIHRMVANMCTRLYGAAPELVLDGDTGASFTYIPIHIEIILLELLKNSMRAVVDFHKGSPLPPLQVTICRGDNDITIRIRDQGGGIDPEHFDAVWDYTYTSHRHNSPVPHLSEWNPADPLAAGPGFGLPMAQIYSSYFGGSLRLFTLHGYGCDTFIKLGLSTETRESQFL
eukprot:comp22202_c0_seq1/m.32649 comp22202_c0_seq1/g.32649  ORF comp22202_c0_seq1/g.32649 comp22202_c0_seq1/m.32649 type:complete len:384 (-) comp22202_c0_seq1:168-1319(-)